MTLAGMIRLDEDALICDFAETYHILTYRQLPLRLAATLAAGLRDDARVKLKAAGMPVGLQPLLLAGIADRVDALRYGLADTNETPPSLVSTLFGEEKKNNSGAQVFDSVDAFQAAYAKAIGGQ